MGRTSPRRARRHLLVVAAALLVASACGTGEVAEPEGMDARPEPEPTLVDPTGDTAASLSTTAGGPTEHTQPRLTTTSAAAARSAPNAHRNARSPVTSPPSRRAPSTSSSDWSTTDPSWSDEWARDHQVDPRAAALPGQLAAKNQDKIEVWSKGERTMVANTYLDKPRWSPDGTKLAYLLDDRRVVVMSYPDWGVVAELTVEETVIDYEWSPDSNHLALTAPVAKCAWFYCYPQEEFGLWVTSLSDRSLHQIAVGGQDPSWSPDGEHLAYFVGYDLHVATRTGDHSRLLYRFDGRASIFEIEWGPSSDWIAAIVGNHSDMRSPQLGLIPALDEPVTIDDFVLWDSELVGPTSIAWGPDGSAIAVGSVVGPLVTAGVGQPLEPLDTDTDSLNVTWSPDGRWLAYDNGDLIEVAPVAGGEVIYLGEGVQPHWRHG